MSMMLECNLEFVDQVLLFANTSTSTHRSTIYTVQDFVE